MSRESISATVRRRIPGIPLILALATLGASTACVHVSDRAWYNGRAMQHSWEYRSVMSGDRRLSTLRGMYYSSDARFISYPSKEFVPFGRW